MKKFLGLDIGEKRIGLAIAQGKIVASYGVIKNLSLSDTVHQIAKIVREEQIGKIIIGLPKTAKIIQTDKIHKFAFELNKLLNIDTAFVDEFLTSKEAERRLKISKLDPRSARYKEEVDKISAQLILEQYLKEND